jgi:hypothetical protein
VKRARGKPGEPGILRIDFPGYTGAQSLEQISWEEFFDKFDEQKLAFLCQETTARGLRSNFNKLIKRPAQKGHQRGASAAEPRTSGNRTTRGQARPAPAGKVRRRSAGSAAKAQPKGSKGGRRKTAR